MREGVVFDRQGKRKYLIQPERRKYRRAIANEKCVASIAFLLTLFYTGCRISEALNLTADRVDLTGKLLVFETLKRRRRGCYRAVPIPDILVRLMRQLLTEINPSERIWKMSRATGFRLVKAYMARAGVRGIQACPKGLRHGFAVACLAEKIPLPTVQKWLGHARMETTAIYLDVSGDEERRLAARLW
jgi:integrase/recombinase XerD